MQNENGKSSIGMLVAILFASSIVVCSSYLRSQASYLVACLLVPLILTVSVRVFAGWSHVGAALLCAVTAPLTGALLLASASVYQEFTIGGVGFLAGGGWGSVFASTIVGMFAGAICGVIVLVPYVLFAAIVSSGEATTNSAR